MSDQQPERPPSGQNPFASSSKWRHQESTAFADFARAQQQGAPREPVNESETAPLAEFLNKNRVEPESRPDAGPNGEGPSPIIVPGEDNLSEMPRESTMTHDIVCGPLLNYRGMRDGHWRGSALIVVRGGGQTVPEGPTLQLRRVGGVDGRAFVAMSGPDASPNGDGAAQNGDGAPTVDTVPESTEAPREIQAMCLYSTPEHTFWAFDIVVEMEGTEVKWEYTIPEYTYTSPVKPKVNSFFVPASTESMRVMFHSCNGFSVGTDEEAWSGPALWNDVNRRHNEAPFHVMLGGGDQIYQDGVRVSGPLREWTDIKDPVRRAKYPFPESLRKGCDEYYCNNYIRWYNTPPFSIANGCIPQLNIWDDHDIIDGFGSYVDGFMKSDVFRGIGGTAHKYYLLFQHHLPPPSSTYTTDAQATTVGSNMGINDPIQVANTYVAPSKTDTEMGYILGPKPGPYVAEHSLNLFARLGARMAFLGIDARTERTRHQVNYPETYKLIFDKLNAELTAAKEGGEPISHLLLLLGVPIAYPRLTWLENVFSSPFMAPAKFLNRRFGFGGSFFNKFDGSVDLLDDLDDHWTARTHKKERKYLIETLQDIGAAHNVRVTILGGDVHLAAVGRFYSNVHLKIPARADHRYMPNIISSAIVNKPPPAAVANLLAHRNKVHHLNTRTDETLLTFFDKQPGGMKKGAVRNHMTMPSRNYAILTENAPHNALAPGGEVEGGEGDDQVVGGQALAEKKRPRKKDGVFALHEGEEGAGTEHRAASAKHGKGHDGSLDIAIRVEIDQHNPEGKTQGYGLTVPVLRYTAAGSSSSSSGSSSSSSRSNRSH